MLLNLQKELELLQTNNQEQNYKLQNIFHNFSITNNQFKGLYIQIPNPQNLLNKVRPEIFNQILEFVDLKSYLSFGLVSRRAYQTIIRMMPNRIAQIQQILMRRKQKLQYLMEQNSEDDLFQDLLQRKQNAEQSLDVLTKRDINEMKKMSHPPVIVEKVMAMVCILFISQFKDENLNWASCLKIIENIQFIQQLKCLDIENINDKQLKVLQNVHSISEQQVQRVSQACLSFYFFIRAVVEIRESKIYKVKSQKDLFEKQIKKDQMALLYLQKMNG
ncbi:unnamed protein product [Paramecium pentaurelia]|uniref:F-box domain-containing protein n=1 Tax=Paramecium pentaurelia TaxID=43138 RepID=A0A8S1VD91_9CILI|nr:unnamed protein product [Paramecium pentaurelia]